VNLLFFDTECCDGRTLCSFGYVLTDGYFNVLKKEDIVINPEKRFALSSYGKTYINLGYPYEVFTRAPHFPSLYQKIRAVLEDGDCLICGHSADNDVLFLHTACERYNLPYIDFSYFDSQALYKKINGKETAQSLEAIAASLGVESAGLHRSDVDAEITMNVVQKMCEGKAANLEPMLLKYPQCVGFSKKGVWKRIERGEYARLSEAIDALEVDKNAPDHRLKGKKIAFSKDCERAEIRKMYPIARSLYEVGAFYVHSVFSAHYYVIHDTVPCKNAEKFTQAVEEGKLKVKIIKLSDLLKMLNTALDEIKEVPDDFFNTRPPYIK